MPSDFGESHRSIEAARFRHRERDLGHLRALKSDVPTHGIVSRIVGGLGRLRPVSSRGSAIALDGHVVTDKICRLADGSMGRVAVRESGGLLSEVCVRA